MLGLVQERSLEVVACCAVIAAQGPNSLNTLARAGSFGSRLPTA
jgi:hypothetical protein